MEEMAPLRQNMGYQAIMFSPTKGTTMIISKEQALLKAQAQLDVSDRTLPPLVFGATG